jgi:hypothetical protein
MASYRWFPAVVGTGAVMSTPHQGNDDYQDQDAEPTMTAPGDERPTGTVAESDGQDGGENGGRDADDDVTGG